MKTRSCEKALVCLLAGGALLMPGLATAAKLPEQEFTIARMAIEEAQEVDADASAGSELMLAEQKYQEAVEKNDRSRDEEAKRLLEQSILHAEHAEVEALQTQADVALGELNAALNSLEAEVGRPR